MQRQLYPAVIASPHDIYSGRWNAQQNFWQGQPSHPMMMQRFNPPSRPGLNVPRCRPHPLIRKDVEDGGITKENFVPFGDRRRQYRPGAAAQNYNLFPSAEIRNLNTGGGSRQLHPPSAPYADSTIPRFTEELPGPQLLPTSMAVHSLAAQHTQPKAPLAALNPVKNKPSKRLYYESDTRLKPPSKTEFMATSIFNNNPTSKDQSKAYPKLKPVASSRGDSRVKSKMKPKDRSNVKSVAKSAHKSGRTTSPVSAICKAGKSYVTTPKSGGKSRRKDTPSTLSSSSGLNVLRTGDLPQPSGRGKDSAKRMATCVVFAAILYTLVIAMALLTESETFPNIDVTDTRMKHDQTNMTDKNTG